MICLPDVNVWIAPAYPCAFPAAAQLTLATFDGNMPARAGVGRILLSSAA
jgi:hypothetical protein